MSRIARLILVVLAASTWLLAPSSAQESKLAPALAAELGALAADERVPVSIVLADQLTDEERLAARALADKDARRAHVIAELRARAERAQAGLLAELAAHEAAGNAANVRPLWIANLVTAELAPDALRSVAARADVARISLDRPAGPEIYAATKAGGVVECGVDLMGADEVWSQYGIEGRGVVVGVLDTGTCLIHPDIANQVWRNPAEVALNQTDEDGNGYVDDLNGWNFGDDDNKVFDPNGHGSHVAGTVAGDGTAGMQSGMAPACEIMTLKLSFTLVGQSEVWEGMQYGVQNGADVLSGSLGWHHNSSPDRATWRLVCDNTIAAGLIVVYAAHNWGCANAPDNVTTPGDVPDVITVGATNCADVKAGFSSCGPVEWASVPPYNDFPWPPGLTKPTIVAPGVATLSHDRCTGYILSDGTSMATPHVSGAIALMLEADPTLDQFGVTAILRATAVDLGPPGNDNGHGSGRVDVLAAVAMALANGNHCEAKVNSCGLVPHISSTGQASASASAGFVVSGSVARTGTFGILAYTEHGAALPPIPFFGGTRCIAAPLRRGPLTPALGGTGGCDASFAVDLNAFASGALGGNPAPFLSIPGTTVHCQWWGRDTFDNGPYLTEALEFAVWP